jgi:hypothetical protein
MLISADKIIQCHNPEVNIINRQSCWLRDFQLVSLQSSQSVGSARHSVRPAATSSILWHVYTLLACFPLLNQKKNLRYRTRVPMCLSPFINFLNWMFFMELGMNIIPLKTTATNLALSNFLHLIILISLPCWLMRLEPQYRQSIQSVSMFSASYLKGSGFISRPGDHLSWSYFLWFSSVSLRKLHESRLN